MSSIANLHPLKSAMLVAFPFINSKAEFAQYTNGSTIIKTKYAVSRFFLKGMQNIIKEPNRKPKKNHEGT